MTWRADVLTLFPEMFPGPLGLSLAGRGLREGLWSLMAHDIRDHAKDRHRSVAKKKSQKRKGNNKKKRKKF